MRERHTWGLGMSAPANIFPLQRSWYFVSVAFVLGFASSIAQVLLIRELLTIFRGNEFIIGMIFTGWFLGIFFGARYNPRTGVEALERRVNLSLVLLPVVLFVMLVIVHFTPVMFTRPAGSFYPLSVEFSLSLFYTIPASFFVGFFFPPVISLGAMFFGEKSGGVMYLVESLGAFLGGLLFSFVLIDCMNPFAVCAILMLLSCLLYLAGRGSLALAPLLALPLALMFFSEEMERGVFKYLWNRTQSGTLIAYKRTRHQTLALGFNERQIAVYGDGILFYTIPDAYEVRNLFHLINSLRNNGSDEMLLFGVGPGSLPYNLVRTNLRSLEYCEVDPRLWDTVKPYRERFYRPAPPDDKLAVVPLDVRYHLAQTGRKYDMIVCLPPMPHNAMLNRFFTREFFSMCRERLKDDGIFITALKGFSSYIDDEQRCYVGSIYKAFSRVFPSHTYTTGEIFYLIGSKNPRAIPADIGALINRYRQRLADTDIVKSGLEEEVAGHYRAEELYGYFELTRLDYFARVMRETLPHVDENRDQVPQAYWTYILHSAFAERSVLYYLLKHWYFFIAALVMLSFIALRGVRRRHGPRQALGGFIIYAVGLVNMSVVLLMIMLYQNFYGVVYYRISLINALFMLGLAGGSFAATRYSIRSLRWVIAAMLVMLLSVFAFIALRAEPVFWMILFMFSLFCGTAFPSLYLALSPEGHHETASNLDAMEFLGSIMGSVATTVLLPAIGIRGALALNTAILAATLVVSVMLHHFHLDPTEDCSAPDSTQ